MQKLGLLIVEPHPVVRVKIESLFINTTFECHTSGTWEEAKAIIDTKRVDVVISEILLGEGSIFDLAPYVKNINPFAEVFAWTKETDKLVLFEVYKIGVDSINSKSWSIQLIRQKILAYAKKRERIDNYLSEYYFKKGNVMKVCGVELHPTKTMAIVDGKKVSLTPHEMLVLAALMYKPGEVVTKEEIIESFDNNISDSQLRVYVHSLKKKTTTNIRSHKGKGYSLKA